MELVPAGQLAMLSGAVDDADPFEMTIAIIETMSRCTGRGVIQALHTGQPPYISHARGRGRRHTQARALTRAPEVSKAGGFRHR
jgi:hypothetical protein